MKAHRIETKLTKNGTLILEDLPFQAGEAVEIIILETQTRPQEANLYSLRGKQPYRYDDPFEPAVPLEDWEVLQ
ncbi:hypothetical protein IQ229_13760 [Nostoc cf. edaphicum LEGE 07299]|uniref:Uncharacterized protein n=1 Tax=Nostoc cf. edaphicum LEGE 07299 TaxID=2777974 RepID=A0ABR9U026_9NOSO|nr:hypothetical protein [Nostoc edaphicum]MBE9105963.1 hypothetical protein [Nostoc cf. edaphicum LEGE 07299]